MNGLAYTIHLLRSSLSPNESAGGLDRLRYHDVNESVLALLPRTASGICLSFTSE
jgi:hypothetical protein